MSLPHSFFRPRQGVFVWKNGAAGLAAELRTDPAVTRGGWIHCAFVHDAAGGELRHYADGVLVAEQDGITFQAHPARIAERVLDPGDGWISVAEGDDGLIKLYTLGPASGLCRTDRARRDSDRPALHRHGYGAPRARDLAVLRRLRHLSRHGRGETSPPAIYRLVQRVDGFVSADSAYTGGRLVTRPLRFTGSKLVLNIDTGAAGFAQVGILDENGRPLPGYTADDGVYLNGNEIDYAVEWLGQGTNLAALNGRTIRLEIRMRGTSLYAFQFLP